MSRAVIAAIADEDFGRHRATSSPDVKFTSADCISKQPWGAMFERLAFTMRDGTARIFFSAHARLSGLAHQKRFGFISVFWAQEGLERLHVTQASPLAGFSGRPATTPAPRVWKDSYGLLRT